MIVWSVIIMLAILMLAVCGIIYAVVNYDNLIE